MPTPLEEWVEETAAHTKPKNIHWCDGSEEENQRLVEEMLDSRTLLTLNQKKFPNCYLHRSDPRDVARVEHLAAEEQPRCPLALERAAPQLVEGLLVAFFESEADHHGEGATNTASPGGAHSAATSNPTSITASRRPRARIRSAIQPPARNPTMIPTGTPSEKMPSVKAGRINWLSEARKVSKLPVARLSMR